MEIKINWGNGLMIGMGIFMLFIIGLGVSIFNQKSDDYDQAYYEKGLDYDKDYAREQRVITEHAKPSVQIVKTNLKVAFKGKVNGRLHFRRPADKAMDKTVAFSSDPVGQYELSTKAMARGRWQLVLEWTDGGKQYMYQQEIFVP